MKTFIEHDLPTTNRVVLGGTRYYVTPQGVRYPSVTSVVGIHDRAFVEEWKRKVGGKVAKEISTRAANRGTLIHDYCERNLRGEVVQPSMFEVEMYNALKPELDKIDNIHGIELPLFSNKLRMAGTVDCIAEYEGELSIIDFKTSSGIKTKDMITSYFLQCAAYSASFMEMTNIAVRNIVIIMGVDGEQRATIFKERVEDWIIPLLKTRVQYKDEFGI